MRIERLPPYATPLERAWHYTLWLICALVLAFLVLPILVIVPLSFSSGTFLTFPLPGFSLRWYEEFFTSGPWRLSLRNSLVVATATAALATALGTLAALGLTRAEFRGKAALMGVIISPMVVPVVIVAVGVYFFYAPLGLTGSLLGLTLAHTALAVPFVVVNVSATLVGFDERLEYAAMNLGANRRQAFLKVTLPLIRPGVLTGALFAFVTSFDELIVALFISGTGAVTLPRKMWDGIRQEIDPTIAAVSTIFIVLSVLILVSAELLRQRSERLRTAVPMQVE